MEIKDKIKIGITSAILAGGLLFGGQAIYKQEIREARMSLLEKRDFTENNKEFCAETPDDRCLSFQEFQLLMKEYNKVKNIDAGKDKKSLKDKLDDKLLK